MKKKYINPSTDIVFLASGCQICIGSPDTSKPTDLDDVEYEGNDPGSFSRRRRNVWDEEEEEEEW